MMRNLNNIETPEKKTISKIQEITQYFNNRSIKLLEKNVMMNSLNNIETPERKPIKI